MIHYLLPPLFLSFSTLILIGFILIASKRKTAVHWVFLTYLLGQALYGTLIYGMRSSPSLDHALVWERHIVFIAPVLSTMMCHFCLIFCGAKSYKLPLIFLYAGTPFFAFPPVASLVVQSMQLRPYGFAPVFGPLSILWFAYTFGPALWALYTLIRYRNRTTSSEHRNRINYVTLGIVIMLVGGIFDILPTYGLPLYPGAIIGFIIFCVLTALAIVRHQLLDIQIVFRRGTTYLITSFIIGIPYAATIVAINHYLSQLSERIIVHIVLLILLAAGLQPIWRWAQDTVDRMFYRGRYDFLNTLTGLTIRTYPVEQISTLLTQVSELLRKVLQCDRCHIMLRSDGSFKDMAVPDPAKQLNISSDHPLITWLERHDGIIRRDQLHIQPQLMVLTKQQSQEISSINAELYVPVKTADRRLIALIAAGSRRSGAPYSLDEQKILTDTASRLAVNLENAYLYATEKNLRERLEKEINSRNEFLTAAAHELRTPLTSILASVELLADEIPYDPKNPRSSLVDNIRVSANILNRRVRELLEFARLKSTGLKLEPEICDIGSTVRNTLKQIEPVMMQKGQKYNLFLTEPLPPVWADPARIEQVLLNLLSNASKFSPRGATISIAAEKKQDQVVVSISDEATPLSEQERGHLFEPYYRGDNPERLATGIGLGLAISKQIIEQHNGRIWAESDTKGNTFYFSLPVAT